MDDDQTPSGAMLLPQAVVEVCLCHHIRRAARAVTQAFDRALATLGLTSTQFDLLATIAAQEPMKTSAVAALLAMDRTSLSRTLKGLKTGGLIDSEGAAGRRAARLRLTPAGHQALRRAMPLWQDTQRRLAERVGGSKVGTLLEILASVTHAATR